MTFTDEANSSTLKLITLDVNKSLTKVLSADTYIGSVLLRAVNSGVQHPIIVYWQLIILNLQPTHSLVVTQSLILSSAVSLGKVQRKPTKKKNLL